MFVRRGVRKIDNHHVQKPTRFGVSTIRYPLCSPIATGGFGLGPPYKDPSLHKLKYETL